MRIRRLLGVYRPFIFSMMLLGLLVSACTSPSPDAASVDATATTAPEPTEEPAATATEEPTVQPSATPTLAPSPTATPVPEQEAEGEVQEATMASSSPELVGPVWRWQQTLMNDGTELVPDNANYTVQFMDDGSASIQADCNQVAATYNVDDGSLTIMPGPSTLVACPEGSLSDQFVANLAAAAIYFFDEGSLYIDLMMDSGTMQLEEQSTDLTGTSWTVTGYNNGREAFVGPLEGTELTANFDAEGTVSGSAGCNRYSASYEVMMDGGISIGMPISTMTACAEPEGVMEQEQEFLAALETVATYSWRGDQLQMRTADDALALTMQKVANSVSGAVTYLPRIALPEDAVITVQIQDTSLADAPAQVIGEQIINTEGRQVPIEYAVSYNPEEIVENHSYSMSARIEDGAGNLLFINDTNIPVITRENPTEDVEILVVPVQG